MRQDMDILHWINTVGTLVTGEHGATTVEGIPYIELVERIKTLQKETKAPNCLGEESANK